MIVREAREDDLPAIVRLLAADPLGATREDPSEPLAEGYRRAFAAMQAQNGNHLLVAEEAGVILGCVQLTIIPGISRLGASRAQLEGVRVAEDARGRRLGEALVTAALARAREAGCTLAQLTTDRARPDAHRFYERLGFVASHVGMKLTLS